jgi:hypothetical protein
MDSVLMPASFGEDVASTPLSPEIVHEGRNGRGNCAFMPLGSNLGWPEVGAMVVKVCRKDSVSQGPCVFAFCRVNGLSSGAGGHTIIGNLCGNPLRSWHYCLSQVRRLRFLASACEGHSSC